MTLAIGIYLKKGESQISICALLSCYINHIEQHLVISHKQDVCVFSTNWGGDYTFVIRIRSYQLSYHGLELLKIFYHVYIITSFESNFINLSCLFY